MRELRPILAHAWFRNLVVTWEFLFGARMRRLDGAK
jgi:hypothetical protein